MKTRLQLGRVPTDVWRRESHLTYSTASNGVSAAVSASNRVPSSFAADEQEVPCRSRLVTPTALWSASVKTALLNSTLTPSFPNEVAIATTHGLPDRDGPTFKQTESPFLHGTLNGWELNRDVQECQFIQILGSGQFGICKGCRNVGLGASAE